MHFKLYFSTTSVLPVTGMRRPFWISLEPLALQLCVLTVCVGGVNPVGGRIFLEAIPALGQEDSYQ